jgi:hypothetical protein
VSDAPPPAPPEAPRAGLRALVRDLLSFDRRVALVGVYTPIALTVLEYVFVPALVPGRREPPWRADAVAALRRALPSVPPDLCTWIWWGVGCLVFLVLLPMLLLRLVAGVRPRETGLRLRGTGRDVPVYLLLALVFAPVVWLASTRSDFRSVYPFYRPRGALGADFVAFEAIYFLQFLGIEYFFRGVWTLGLKPALGRASVLVMLAPYCMIHYHKPMLEALGAIGAGAVLGCLSWRTGTVVYGWFLHYAVALSMDLLALSQSGRL